VHHRGIECDEQSAFGIDREADVAPWRFVDQGLSAATSAPNLEWHE